MKKWWNTQTKRTKTFLIAYSAVMVCVVAIGGVYGLTRSIGVNPQQGSVALQDATGFAGVQGDAGGQPKSQFKDTFDAPYLVNFKPTYDGNGIAKFDGDHGPRVAAASAAVMLMSADYQKISKIDFLNKVLDNGTANLPKILDSANPGFNAEEKKNAVELTKKYWVELARFLKEHPVEPTQVSGQERKRHWWTPMNADTWENNQQMRIVTTAESEMVVTGEEFKNVDDDMSETMLSTWKELTPGEIIDNLRYKEDALQKPNNKNLKGVTVNLYWVKLKLKDKNAPKDNPERVGGMMMTIYCEDKENGKCSLGAPTFANLPQNWPVGKL